MKNIILTGFMGSGKTTIGKILANKINMKFVDIDEEIEKTENLNIDEIFDSKGELYFRQKEAEILNKLTKQENQIISTGGGIIETGKNIDLLNNQKCVVWLNANANTIYRNICNEIDKRPKLNKEKNIELTINNLLKNRYYKYKEVSDIIIDVNNKNIDEVISDILVYID